jgi:hypothetical protein
MGELVDVGADAAELAVGGLVDAGRGRREGSGEGGIAEVLADRDLVEGREEAELLVLGRRETDRGLDAAEAKRVFARAAAFGHGKWLLGWCSAVRTE